MGQFDPAACPISGLMIARHIPIANVSDWQHVGEWLTSIAPRFRRFVAPSCLPRGVEEFASIFSSLCIVALAARSGQPARCRKRVGGGQKTQRSAESGGR